MSDTTINIPGDSLPTDQRSAQRAERAAALSSEALALYVGAEEQPIIVQIPLRERAHLGRYVAAFSAQPLIDLTPYGAFEKGVSRMHAAIQRTEDNGIVVEDLDSSNGTYLNGARLMPHTPTPLTSGDSLRLSNLPIQVFFASTVQPSPDDNRALAEPAINPLPQETPANTQPPAPLPTGKQPGDKPPETKQFPDSESTSPEPRPALILKEHTGAVQCLAFSPDGKRLASAGADGTLRLWDSTTGKLLAVLKGHIGAVHSIVFSPDGKRLASAGADGTVRLWDLSSS